MDLSIYKVPIPMHNCLLLHVSHQPSMSPTEALST
jgi:hypothetical protein